MELTKEYLESHGYQTNHPDYVLKKYYKTGKNPEYRIMVEPEYIPTTNVLAYNVICWKCNKNGAIVKRSSVSWVRTIEDLNNCIQLCEIDLND